MGMGMCTLRVMLDLFLRLPLLLPLPCVWVCGWGVESVSVGIVCWES